MHGGSRLLPGFVAFNLGLTLTTFAQDPAPYEFVGTQWLPSREVVLLLSAPPGDWIRVERSTDLKKWDPFQTLQFPASTEPLGITDSTAPSNTVAQFYRARSAPDGETLAGDHLVTDDGDVLIHPVNHASFVLRWKERMIYNDHVGGSAPFSQLPPADLVLVSHQHGDHFHAATLSAVLGPEGVIIAPAAVFGMMSSALQARTTPLANGESTNVLGLTVEAVPAYNNNHPRGAGNGYVITIAGRRLYVSGDTGAIVETRALRDIDVAFLSMNVPFTMNVQEAASVARDFRPRVLYPYHYRNQNGTFADLNVLKEEIGPDAGVAIRPRDWY